jgi:hypothetical protein
MPEANDRLDALARAATVHLLPLEGDGAGMWGSGFFVAPGWVLTCAHVVHGPLRRNRDLVFAVRGKEVNDGIPVKARLESWLSEPSAGKVSAQEDLALVRLLDDVEHECVWLADRSAQHLGPVIAYGYRPDPPDSPVSRAVPWSAHAEINVRDDDYGLCFKPDTDFPPGVSGGPLLDQATGAVVGLIKARRTTTYGGLAVAGVALRRFRETYERMIVEHDQWHGRVPRLHGDNWIHEQRRLPGASEAGRPEVWSPEDRRAALGLLAALPPPGASPPIMKLVRKAMGGSRLLHGPADPITWRDGHGLLYDGGKPLEPLAFLHYLRLVVLYVRSRGGDADRLADWIDERLAQDTERRPLHCLVTDARLPDELTPVTEYPDRVVIPYPGPGEGTTVTLVLDPVIGETGRYYWTLYVNDGEGGSEIAAEDYSGEGLHLSQLSAQLRAPLSSLFQEHDEVGRPIPLEVAVHLDDFDAQVHRWPVADISPLYEPGRLGEQRRVVLRDLARRGVPDDEARRRWESRWAALSGARNITALRTPARGERPQARRLQEVPDCAVPVMCWSPGHGTGREAMNATLEAGHGVALWHVDGHSTRGCGDECEDLHTRIEELLGRLGSAAELPDRLRHMREEIGRADSGRRWAEPLALLYDDPRRPVPPEDGLPLDSPA